MKTIDLEKLKVGDTVYSITKGEGTVASTTAFSVIYPIEVVFNGGEIKSFTSDGKLYINDCYPNIYQEPVKIVPENNSEILDLDNVGKVMEVSNDNQFWFKRVVFGKRNGKYLSLFKFETLKEAKEENEVRDWNYAREISQPKEYTLDEIAKALNINVNDLKIKK